MNTIRPFFNKLLTILFVLILTLFVPCDIFRNFGSLLMLEAAELPYTQWHLPEGATAHLGKGRVNDITFSPNGTQFAVATTFGTWIYDAQTGKEDALLTGHEEEVKSAVFSPDGRNLISLDSGGESRRWDATTGEQLSILTESTDLVLNAALSADSTKLVTQDMDNKFRIWQLKNDNPTPDVINDVNDSGILTLAISPDGNLIASSKIGDSPQKFIIQVHNTIINNHLYSIDGDTGQIYRIKFSPDGKILAGLNENGQIQLWDTDNGSPLPAFEEDNLSSLAFSSDGRLLAAATGEPEGEVLFWNLKTNELSRQALKVQSNDISILAFSPDNKTLLVASKDGNICSWDIHTGNQLFLVAGHTGPMLHLTYSDTNNTLTTINSSSWIWNTKNIYRKQWDFDTNQQLSIDILKTKGVKVISTDGNTVVVESEDGALDLLDISTKNIHSTLRGFPENNQDSQFAFSLDGNYFTSVGKDHVIRLWKIPSLQGTSQPLYTFDEHQTDWDGTLAFSQDSKTLANSRTVNFNRNTTIQLWNVETGETHLQFDVDSSHIFTLAFSPDEKILAGGSEDTLYLWETSTGNLISECIPDRLCSSMTLVFSQDSKTLISATGGTIIHFPDDTIKLEDGGILSGSLSPLGGGVIQLWDVQTGELLSTHAGHKNFVKTMALSKDGKTLATGSWDGTILLWDWEKIVSDR